MKKLSPKQFQKLIWQFYATNKRDLPWRPPTLKLKKDGSADPYKVLVSEIMLQQTQVDRVIHKYKAWLKRFPNFKTLAASPLTDVLSEWKGLGYNRRAKALKNIAEVIFTEYKNKFPQDFAKVLSLPGIGPYTAGALMAFVFNKAHPIVETNIRTVYIHHFFNNKEKVSDQELLRLVEETLSQENPRDWYYALMDYGSFLKKTVGNHNNRSATYRKQSQFKGSVRELRAFILHALTLSGPKKMQSVAQIQKLVEKSGKDASKVEQIVNALEKEQFIRNSRGRYGIMQ